MTTRTPIVIELVDLIRQNGWEDEFKRAILHARKYNIPQLEDIHNLDDYLNWIDGLLCWVPTEDKPGREIYNHLCKFHFILDQPPVKALQNRIVPHPSMPPLTPLSAWMVRYANVMGAFLDTPESLTLESLQTFYDSPTYNMDDVTLRKGEEISYFQFGGSDIIVLFEAKSNVSFTAQPIAHYKMGTRIAEAFPVT